MLKKILCVVVDTAVLQHRHGIEWLYTLSVYTYNVSARTA
jgi:hypothetical protein